MSSRNEKVQKALPAKFAYASIECCMRGGGGGGGGCKRATFISWPYCFGVDSVPYNYASCIPRCPSTSKLWGGSQNV